MPAPWVFDQCFFKIRQMRDRDLIREICLLRRKIGHSGRGHGERFFKSGFRGWVTFDLAIYPVTTFVALVGPAYNVVAFFGHCHEETSHNGEIWVEVEDNAVLNLDFRGGTFGDIFANYCIQTQHGPSLEVYGSKGEVFVENGYLRFPDSQDDARGLPTSEPQIAALFPCMHSRRVLPAFRPASRIAAGLLAPS